MAVAWQAKAFSSSSCTYGSDMLKLYPAGIGRSSLYSLVVLTQQRGLSTEPTSVQAVQHKSSCLSIVSMNRMRSRKSDEAAATTL